MSKYNMQITAGNCSGVTTILTAAAINHLNHNNVDSLIWIGEDRHRRVLKRFELQTDLSIMPKILKVDFSHSTTFEDIEKIIKKDDLLVLDEGMEETVFQQLKLLSEERNFTMIYAKAPTRYNRV